MPLLPRASPLTELTRLAGRAARDLAAHNTELLPPWHPRPAPAPPQPGGEEEGGVVVLPSGAAVRLSDRETGGRRGGKRKRSSPSRSIEVFPGGLAELEASTRVKEEKLSSVVGAGHGYARPAPNAQPAPACRLMAVSDQTRRGRPSLPLQSSMRGRPRLLGSRRGGPSLSSPRLQAAPASILPAGPVLLPGPRPAVPVPPRQAGPARELPVTVAAGLHPVKVFHSAGKLAPRAGGAVYVVPRAGRPAGLATPRLLGPSVIRTVRARQPGKPSVIVVGRQGGLYRAQQPAHTLVLDLSGQTGAVQSTAPPHLASILSASGILPDPSRRENNNSNNHPGPGPECAPEQTDPAPAPSNKSQVFHIAGGGSGPGAGRIVTLPHRPQHAKPSLVGRLPAGAPDLQPGPAPHSNGDSGPAEPGQQEISLPEK